MELLTTIFNGALYHPLLNVLFLFYHYLPGQDLGIAVILLTVLIKFIFYPLGTQTFKSQKAMSEIQPRIKEIQEKYKGNREGQSKAMMELYKEKKINPLSGCLPLLLQLPILIALYQVFLKGIHSEAMAHLYSFVPHPAQIDPTFLGLVNLSQPNFILAILAGVTQYFQLRMTPQTKKTKGGSWHFSDDDRADEFSLTSLRYFYLPEASLSRRPLLDSDDNLYHRPTVFYFKET